MRLFKPILLLDGGAYNGLRDRVLSEIRWRFLCTKFHIHGFILHIFPDFLKNSSKSLSWDIFWKSKLRFAAWTSQIFSLWGWQWLFVSCTRSLYWLDLRIMVLLTGAGCDIQGEWKHGGRGTLQAHGFFSLGVWWFCLCISYWYLLPLHLNPPSPTHPFSLGVQ